MVEMLMEIRAEQSKSLPEMAEELDVYWWVPFFWFEVMQVLG